MSQTITEKVFHQLHHCMNMLRRGHGLHEGHNGRDAHRGQGRIIALLCKTDGISQRELAEILGVRPPSLSEVLNKLEGNELIERRPHDDDKRISTVFITEKGREAAKQVELSRQERAETLLTGLSLDERESLSGLLEKLIVTLKAAQGDEGDESEGRGHGRGHRGERRGHGGHGGHDAHGGRRHGRHGREHTHGQAQDERSRDDTPLSSVPPKGGVD